MSTAATFTASNLKIGNHLITLEVWDANGTYSRAATTLSVGYGGGVPCSAASDCLSGYCTNGTCCAPGICGKVQVANGEVFLKGNYLEVGIHSAGNFGTAADKPVSFNGATGARNPWGRGVGFSVDYNRDGFGTGTPTYFSGDYFLPGSPVEGWVVSYSTTSTGTVIPLVNKGRMGKADFTQVRALGVCVCVHRCVPVVSGRSCYVHVFVCHGLRHVGFTRGACQMRWCY